MDFVLFQNPVTSTVRQYTVYTVVQKPNLCYIFK